ncbi:MAG: hypothetical protein V8T90_17950 [Victivallales bacterium]
MRFTLKIMFAIVFATFCFRLGGKLSFDAHIKIYDTLLTASGILFGVFGLWVSVLYPGILEKSLQESGKAEWKGTISAKADQLLRPLFIALFLFLIMIIVVFIAPFVRALNFSQNIRFWLKCISASVAGLIFISLMDSVLQAMNQTEAFQTMITRNAILTDMKTRFMSGICRNKKK